MGQKKLLKIENLTEHTFKLTVERDNSRLKAGQCYNVGLVGLGINREYSIYSGENESHLQFLIREVEGGIVSPALKNLQAGAIIDVDGPYGEFCIKEQYLSSPHLFIATGTGIAPFHSYVKTYPNLNYKILHGIRYASEMYDQTDYRKNSYVACISKNSAGRSMRVSDYLRENKLPTETVVYLCGNRNMIIECYELLHEQGIAGDQIFTEVFF